MIMLTVYEQKPFSPVEGVSLVVVGMYLYLNYNDQFIQLRRVKSNPEMVWTYDVTEKLCNQYTVNISNKDLRDVAELIKEYEER